MNNSKSEPIPRWVRDAFHGAVQLYGDWSSTNDGPVVKVGDRLYTIRQACEFAAGFEEEMPESLVGNLIYFLNAGDKDLLEELGKDRSYAGGARYVLKLMSRRSADQATLEQSRPGGSQYR
jgi:hypothetical protein